jgi:FtsH-binding integral membrane protein
MRPKSIQRFDLFYLGALALGLVSTAIGWNATMERMQADAATAAVATPVMLGSVIIGFGISLLLWFFTSRMRSAVAKWIVVIFFVLGVLSLVFTMLNGASPGGIPGILSIVSTVLQAAAVYMLFQPDAVAWFKGEPTGDPTTPFE